MAAKEEKDVAVIDGAVEEPNDSERFISGGERSEETGICLGDVLSCELFAIVNSGGDLRERIGSPAGGRVFLMVG